ncbi:sensor histidine kinase [Marinomonas ostreistagni]|uniref:histidine kinase n=1 Tax=Marinomonas ostreistagni TaxID=359209 RepID=A0ABS0ZE80_9GAMM|nr:HAMP domain-containing histidine kinase [Marinomonas ostreistagni]MBJ7551969.1 HAMP domain-containing histidine kinase [Marinomonas ostreistagni]
MPYQSQLPFKEVIEASIKDMRNSLSQVLFNLDNTINRNESVNKDELVEAQYEIVRMQNVINQLYGLYLVSDDHLVVNSTDTFVMDVVEDALAGLDTLLKHKTIEVNIKGEDLSWYLDPQLISNVLQITLLNALRYTEDTIEIEFTTSEEGLHISVIDNGKGYPDFILASYEALIAGDPVENVSSQNAGWFYCDKVVRLHNNQGVHGHTKLKNNEGSCGGRIDMLIP